jgi:hypothetical protein
MIVKEEKLFTVFTLFFSKNKKRKRKRKRTRRREKFEEKIGPEASQINLDVVYHTASAKKKMKIKFSTIGLDSKEDGLNIDIKGICVCVRML